MRRDSDLTRPIHCHRASFLLALLVASAVAGCTAPLGGLISTWATGPSELLGADAAAPRDSDVYSATANQIDLYAAANEVTAFQFVVANGGGAAIAFEPLRGPDAVLPVARFAAWMQRDVRVGPMPGWHLRRHGIGGFRRVPDVLVPLDAANGTAPLPAGESVQRLWIEYDVPIDAPPGQYLGAIRLMQGERIAARTAVVLTVWPFALPRRRAVEIIAGFDAISAITNSPAGREEAAAALQGKLGPERFAASAGAAQAALAMLSAHGLSAYPTHIHPSLRFGEDGRIELDWSAYDALVSPLLGGVAPTASMPAADAASASSATQPEAADYTTAGTSRGAGLPPRWWPLPVSRDMPAPGMVGGGAERYERVLRDWIAACRAHLDGSGWPIRTFVDLTAASGDGRSARDYSELQRVGEISAAAAPDALFVVNTPPASLAPYGWFGHPFRDLSGMAGIRAPAAPFADFDAFRAGGAGGTAWFQPRQPPFGGSMQPGAAAADACAIAWHAWLNGCAAWLSRGGAIGAPAGSSSLQPDIAADALLYRVGAGNASRLCPSLRLKQLQRGLQDAAYLELLAANHRGGAARLIAGSLLRGSGAQVYCDNFADAADDAIVLDPAMWELARRIMADEICDALGGLTADPGGGGAAQARWARLLAATRRTLVSVDGARCARSEDRSAEGSFGVSVAVTIANHRTTELRGTMSVAAVPNGWHAVTGSTAIGPLSAGGRMRCELSLTAPAWPVTADGHVLLPIRLDGRGAEPMEAPAVISMLTARRSERAIQIDGRIGEWSLSPGCTAANFIRVGGSMGSDGARAPQPARSPTVAFACLDGESLCFALRATGGIAAADVPRSNRPVYDELIPIGQELMEILIDPTHAAGDSAGLYHLVFARSGAMWTEQGVSVQPPIGRRKAWGLDIEYATRADGEGWTVEARIPMGAFGEARAADDVWGVNFTRFAAGEAEYASWSGAARYCYNPASLGNMALERPVLNAVEGGAPKAKGQLD